MSFSSQKLNTKKTDNCWIFFSAICQIEIAWAVLKLFWQVVRRYKVWRAGVGYRLALFSFTGARFSIFKIVSDQQWKKCGTFCEVETVRMNFLPAQHHFSSFVWAVLSKRSTIEENLAYSKKESAEQKIFVCVGKHTAVVTHNQINSILAAKAWKRECLKTMVMVSCPNHATVRKMSKI